MLENVTKRHFFHFFHQLWEALGPKREFSQTCAMRHFFRLTCHYERLVFDKKITRRFWDNWPNIQILPPKKCKKFWISCHPNRIKHRIEVFRYSFESLSLTLSTKKTKFEKSWKMCKWQAIEKISKKVHFQPLKWQ